jgi:hypothetical protein
MELRVGDRVRITFEDDLTGAPLFAHVCRLLSDKQEGLGVEVEDYVADWLEFSETGCEDKASRRTMMLGNDEKPYLDGRPVRVEIVRE